MDELLDPVDEDYPDMVDYGPEWEESMIKLTVSINDPAANKDAAKSIINHYMWSCPIDEIEVKILSIVCPFLEKSIIQTIDDVEKQLDDSEIMKNLEPTTFDNQFIEIKNLLGRWREILSNLGVRKLTPSQIKSLRQCLPNVVIKIGGHCKNKRVKYSNRTIPLLLQDIYRDTCSIVKNYCALFIMSVEFNFNLNEDLEASKQIITGLGEMAPYTSYGMSTVIHTWKTFRHLTCINQELRKNKDVVDLVRGYFKTLANDIIRLLKQIMRRSQEEFINIAKCCNILSEILTELHEFYCTKRCPHPLDFEFVRDMVHVLIEFIGHFEICLASNDDTGMSYHRSLIIKIHWAKTLNDYYKKSEHYLPAFLANAAEIKNISDPDYALGFHYCLLHYKVFNEAESLDMALENINYIQVEIMQQLTRMLDWGTSEGGMCDAHIYEYTLSILCRNCSFLTDPHSFSKFEHILIKHLFSERFWSSLLAYDILTHCYACSDKNVALTHIQYFMMVYDTLYERKDDCLAITLLRKLIINIYKSLPKRKVEELLQKCKSPISLLLILKSGVKNSSQVLATYKKLSFAQSSSNLPEAITNLEQQPSVKNWTRLMNILTVMGVEQDENNEKWTENLLEITSCTLQSVKELEDDNQQRMMYDLILILFDCARIREKKGGRTRLNWPLFVALAEGLVELTDVPDDFLIKLCHYLRDNANYLMGPYDDEKNIIPAVFIYLLENNSKLVYQEALECFDQIVEMSNENLVKEISSAIAKRPKLCEAVPAYLKGEQFPRSPNDGVMPEGWRNYETITSVFNKLSMKHKCYKNEVRVRDEKLPKLSEESLETRIMKLTNELTELTRENISFFPVAAEKLKSACRFFVEK